MQNCSRRWGRGWFGFVAGGLLVALLLHPLARAQLRSGAVASGAANPPVTAAQIESTAFHDILAGKFQDSSTLLATAAGMTPDPQVAQMSRWAHDFEVQNERFAADRNKQFQQNIADAHLLLDHHMDSYALDEVALAYPMAVDSTAFRHEPWVEDLVNSSIAAAAKAEESGEWLLAQGYYEELGQLDPSVAKWKDKLELVRRRVRLLFVYTPDRLKRLRDAEVVARQAADDLIHPSTQPSNGTGAATRPAENAFDATDFQVDWKDVTKGIEEPMLWQALRTAESEYYRAVTYQDLLKGGLMGLRAVVTTDGLQDAFPGLGDKVQRDAFLGEIDHWEQQAQTATAADARDITSSALTNLISRNRQTVKLPEEVLVSEFADGAFSKLDPFSTMIWPYDMADFKKQTQGEFGGVGIQIESDEWGNLKVVSPLEDTPAYKAGIKAGDTIAQIDGKNAKGIALDRAVKAITGTPGTKVLLSIRSPDGTLRDYNVQRELIKVDSVRGFVHKLGGGWDYFIDPEQKIAYIRLSAFSKDSADDMHDAIKEVTAQGARGMVLDLRRNPGGLLNAATDIVNKFVASGVIVTTKPDRPTSNAPSEVYAQAGNQETRMPLVVLVNQLSASASEIVSGALKDDHRALIVGERTFGKGSVQMLEPMGSGDYPAALKLTTSHYYLPDGTCIHREEDSVKWGVDPDVPVAMTPQQVQTAMNAQQALDVLRSATDFPSTRPTTQPADVIGDDLQLSAGLLVLRMELDGATF